MMELQKEAPQSQENLAEPDENVVDKLADMILIQMMKIIEIRPN